MAKPQKWNVILNSQVYSISFFPNNWGGKHKLVINEKELAIKGKLFQGITGFEQPIMLGSYPAQFVMRKGGQGDIAVNGKFTRNPGSYTPLKSIPAWVWIFILACVLIPIISLGGAIPAIIAVLGVLACIKLSSLEKIKMPTKVLACLGVTVAAWGLFFLMLFMVNSIL